MHAVPLCARSSSLTRTTDFVAGSCLHCQTPTRDPLATLDCGTPLCLRDSNVKIGGYLGEIGVRHSISRCYSPTPHGQRSQAVSLNVQSPLVSAELDVSCGMGSQFADRVSDVVTGAQLSFLSPPHDCQVGDAPGAVLSPSTEPRRRVGTFAIASYASIPLAVHVHDERSNIFKCVPPPLMRVTVWRLLKWIVRLQEEVLICVRIESHSETCMILVRM